MSEHETKRQRYERQKAELLASIERLRRPSFRLPAAVDYLRRMADYLEEHLHWDDESMTVRYSGAPDILDLRQTPASSPDPGKGKSE